MNDITQAMVRKAFYYNDTDGVLIWASRPIGDFQTKNAWATWNAKYAMTEAGWIGTNGYRYIRFAGKCRKASRLIWLYHTGTYPDRIDHISGETDDDHIENLRDVSPAENNRNRALSKNNKSGVHGVVLDKSGVWRVQINVDRKRIHLGSFTDFDMAVAARRAAEREHGFHANHGRS